VKRETGDEAETGGTRVAIHLGPVSTGLDPVGESFRIPTHPASYLQRSRLFEDLELGVGGPLTLVSAPAGTGKTVLVSAWASRARMQRPVAWVTFEARHEVRMEFWSSFTRGLRRCGVTIPLPPVQIGSADLDDDYVDAMVSALLRRAELDRAEPVVVVLDCEASLPAAVAQDLDTVLRGSGGWLRLVVVTRVDPLLPLHRYRLAGSLVEIRATDLAFTQDEARELLSKVGVELSDVALQALVDRTGGWAAGLRLAAVSLYQREDRDRAALGFRGDTGNVAEYLIAEVLDRQPAEIRRLLLETSIVDVLRPGLSEAVAGPHAQRALARLARGNVFLDELTDSPGCYRYQPLFLDLLRAQLSSELPGRVPELHRAAAVWMFDQGLVEEAVRHSAAAADWEGAARYVIDDLAIGRLLLPGPDPLAEALARLPDNTEGAAASLVRAALAMAAFDVEECEEHLTHAETQLDGSTGARLSAAGLALQTLRLTHASAVSNVDRGLVAAAAAERLIQRQVRERVDQHPELSALIQSSKGAAWLMKGDLDSADVALSAGAREANRPGCEHSLLSCLGPLALLAAIVGQLRKAVDLNARVTAVQQHARIDPDDCPGAAVALAWVKAELYDLPAARRQVHQAAEQVAVAHDPTLPVMLALVDSRVRRASGDVDGALARIVACRSDDPELPQWPQDLLCIEEAELNIANGRPGLAIQLVEGLARQGSPEGVLVLARARMAAGEAFEPPATTSWSAAASLSTRVGGWLFEATRQMEAGQELRAVQALERALRLASPERLRRPFRESSPQVRQLLRGERQLTAEHSWLGAATLDDAPPARQPRRDMERDDSPDHPAASPLLETLTEKEREVLGHLAELLTTDEIAGAMFVSVNTVRTHVRNILRKLAASRRNEAVRRARELGIIPSLTMVESSNGSAGSRPN
jgi:LuxR family transcriptional regulator, maltose regulon positive regulatory protein